MLKRKLEKGQAMVEFAMVFPAMLIMMLVLINSAHLLVVLNMVENASREAARYGAALGVTQEGVARYQDCQGITDLAKQVGFLAFVNDADVVIEYDNGPETAVFSACPNDVVLGDRIKVTVTGHYEMLVPIFEVPSLPYQSVSYHTIMTNVPIGE